MPRDPRPIALSLALVVALAPAAAIAQPGPPAAEIAAGDKASRAKDFTGALAHYQAANQAAPSVRAELGVAGSLYQLGRVGEAYEAYQGAQLLYGSKLAPLEQALVTNRLKELAAKTGWISIRVAEPGAQVDLDGAPMGVSPVPALVRVAKGPHEVRVTKAGLPAFAGHADVAADGTAVVDVKLDATPAQAHVVVHASGNEPLRVLVDGVDVGATPWEGDLPAGTHSIEGRSSSAVAEAQSVELTSGSRTSIDLVASATTSHMQVRTSDGKGTIFVDGVAKGEGAYAADVTPGPHTVVVTREGFQRYEKAITLAERQTWAETVTLDPVAATGAVATEGERGLEGIYGGFGLFGASGVGGMGTELATDCANLGASSCSTPSPLGGGAFGYVGYSWNPVGFELMLGGEGDTVKQTATFTGTTSVPTASGPPRTETFDFARFGGVAAVRARATFQTRFVRGTVAGGIGLSYRQMLMERSAVAASDPSLTAKYVPGGVGYLSPAITAEAAVQIRVSQTLALSAGLFLWADNASIAGSNVAPAGKPQVLTNGNPPSTNQSIPTPQVHLATGTQVLLGPFLGMQFGP